MKPICDVKISKKCTLRDALSVIDAGALKMALVIDEEQKLVGTVSDGDVRRGILRGISLDSCVLTITNRNPITACLQMSREEIVSMAVSKKIYQVPVVDDHGVVVGVHDVGSLVKPDFKKNKVVLMVGGLGKRLRPLTENVPKPMLNVGDKPILQTIIERFVDHGYTDIIMCVNYRSDMIVNYFDDGSKFGANIEYFLEEEKMGTAGALSMIKDKIDEPFFVMNGDLLTSVNFEHMHDYHTMNNAMATMCVREYDFQVPYGVVSVDDQSNIEKIEEKPLHKFLVSAGIYMLSPKALDFIPSGYYDMPSLFDEIIGKNLKAVSFPLREYWIDIGQIEEYNKANQQYHEVF
ncbi:nucleotidyltransferase family protein [Francisella philomiragia]|uniref:Nucleotidyl transferase n=1 Tax=Francisella philomiragia subsp. philomiragia (strain ATCC 25017 / CCUG 19701 / FSC 153 / O\|nr:nucleotidyltransferase family protein [Francisella philomiragia]AJI47136.1 nucleotidyl transferase family protein [Francisella philomiragia]AJI50097.1 nucleotidyl transferase family protein [Francisella philomiragia]MBK2019703.1 nucleotidyltransferase family protein [Francisella philomiragia]MBK2029508.1 nucleotidyltransferase family protein [Francisella philomiragia]MBK2264034.1 nucleotidyltransferase family protein [Francisella philomiragia]